MTNYKKWYLNNIRKLLCEHKLWCLGYLAGLSFVLFVAAEYRVEIIQRSGSLCSTADLYILGADIFLWTYAILPADIFTFLLWSRNDLLAQPVLLAGSKLKIFIGLFKKIVLIAVVQTILMDFLLLQFGSLFSMDFCNFNSNVSTFYMSTKQTVDVSIVVVIIYYSCIVLIRTILALWVSNLITWCLKQEFLSFVLCVGIGTAESMGDNNIFFGYLKYSYQSFISEKDIQKSILYTLGLSIALIILSGIVIKRKEFYREQPI